MPPPIEQEKNGKPDPKLMSLSPMQNKVASAISSGKRNKEIAEALDISVHTVDHHCRRLYAKMGVSSRAEAAVVFLQLCSVNA